MPPIKAAWGRGGHGLEGVSGEKRKDLNKNETNIGVVALIKAFKTKNMKAPWRCKITDLRAGFGLGNGSLPWLQKAHHLIAPSAEDFDPSDKLCKGSALVGI